MANNKQPDEIYMIDMSLFDSIMADIFNHPSSKEEDCEDIECEVIDSKLHNQLVIS